jgi:hypothetical protein
MALQITSPAPNAVFIVTAEPAWPVLQFQTNASISSGQKLTWSWKIQWDKFSKQGKDQTSTNSWNAQSALFQTLTAGVITNLGGRLTVQVTGASGSAQLVVQIKGTNPTRADVIQFLSQQPNSTGFERILDHESHMQHFKANGEPIKSFDGGYGIAQLTNPSPSYEQAWNWKLNIAVGLALYQTKQASAIVHLSQNHRSYTQDQLIRETICRWNGGTYHVWSGKAWTRPSNIVCDTQTGNIGWDMNNRYSNAGNVPPEAGELRFRSRACLSRRRLETRVLHFGDSLAKRPRTERAQSVADFPHRPRHSETMASVNTVAFVKAISSSDICTTGHHGQKTTKKMVSARVS